MEMIIYLLSQADTSLTRSSLTKKLLEFKITFAKTVIFLTPKLGLLM